MHLKVVRTKQALRDALYSLVDIKPLNEITVAELCQKANINRTTFYNHYSIPTDILREIATEYYQSAMQEVARTYDINVKKDIYQKMLNICQNYYNDREILQVVMRHLHDFMPFMQQYSVTNTQTNTLTQHPTELFISGGISVLLAQWCAQGFPYTPKEMAAVLTKLVIKNTEP